MDLLRSARIKPAVLQIEHHPYLVQQELLDLCAENSIAVTAYFSFGPTSYIELDTLMKKQQAQQATQDTLFDKSTFNTAGNRAVSAPGLFENATISSIARKHGCTPAQVLLRWATQRGIAVIPKSVNPQRLAQNLDSSSFDLDNEEIAAISGLDMGLRFNNPSDMVKKFHIFA
jgi:D-xylose reductase